MRSLIYHTLEEVAEITRQHIETVRKQVKSGEIAATPVGNGKVRRKYIVSDEALRAFLAYRTETAQPGPTSKRSTHKPTKQWV